MSEPWGTYVHVPWCRMQCAYCAFDVQVGDAAPEAEPWQQAVLSEFDRRSTSFTGPPATLFFGGGTPSRVSPDVLAEIVDHIHPTTEVSAEANPEDLSATWLDGARGAGVHRLSVGVQSFDPAVRKRLGRAWVTTDPHPVVARVANAGFRSWSIDLIFAAPGQTLTQLDADLDAIEAYGVPHVSLYGLTIEPNTPFALAHKRGQLAVPSDDLWRTMYDHIVHRLGQMGLERYELSNFARDGHQSMHNAGYWSDRPYLGLGPAAHSYLPDGQRTQNHAQLSAYLRAGDPVAESETPSPEERYVDTLVSGLRCIHGVEIARLQARTGLVPDEQAVERMVTQGLAVVVDGWLRLTEAGFPLCDAAVAHLAARPAVHGLSPGP